VAPSHLYAARRRCRRDSARPDHFRRTRTPDRRIGPRTSPTWVTRGTPGCGRSRTNGRVGARHPRHSDFRSALGHDRPTTPRGPPSAHHEHLGRRRAAVDTRRVCCDRLQIRQRVGTIEFRPCHDRVHVRHQRGTQGSRVEPLHVPEQGRRTRRSNRPATRRSHREPVARQFRSRNHGPDHGVDERSHGLLLGPTYRRSLGNR